MVKTMKCCDLYGPVNCNVEITGESAEQMMENSQKHGMEMYQSGDADHVRVMEDMKKKMETITPEEQAAWMEEFHAKFESA